MRERLASISIWFLYLGSMINLSFSRSYNPMVSKDPIYNIQPYVNIIKNIVALLFNLLTATFRFGLIRGTQE